VKIYVVKEVSQTGPRVVRLSSRKGANLHWKRAKRLNENFSTKFLKLGPKMADLATLAWSARTVSRELYLEKRVYIGLTSYG